MSHPFIMLLSEIKHNKRKRDCQKLKPKLLASQKNVWSKKLPSSKLKKAVTKKAAWIKKKKKTVNKSKKKKHLRS